MKSVASFQHGKLGFLETGVSSHEIIALLTEIIIIILNICILNEGKKRCLHDVSPLRWMFCVLKIKMLCVWMLVHLLVSSC